MSQAIQSVQPMPRRLRCAIYTRKSSEEGLDMEFWEMLNQVVQDEPTDTVDPTTLGFWASIGILKGKPFAPDERMKKILTEAAAVGDATARTIAYPHNHKGAELMIFATKAAVDTISPDVDDWLVIERCAFPGIVFRGPIPLEPRDRICRQSRRVWAQHLQREFSSSPGARDFEAGCYFFRQGGKSMRFKLVDEAKKSFPIYRLCRVLGVSESGYYAWKQRGPSRRQLDDMVLLAHIRSQFVLSHETYGSPRMHVELCEDGQVYRVTVRTAI